ncbi:MAG: hypothetical protein ACOCUR_00500, partial [Nanoarchaeota archaeon]
MFTLNQSEPAAKCFLMMFEGVINEKLTEKMLIYNHETKKIYVKSQIYSLRQSETYDCRNTSDISKNKFILSITSPCLAA